MSESPAPDQISVTGARGNSTRILYLEGDVSAEELINIFSEYLEGSWELGKVDENYLSMRTDKTRERRLVVVGKAFASLLQHEVERRLEQSPSLLDTRQKGEVWYKSLLVHWLWMKYMRMKYAVGVSDDELRKWEITLGYIQEMTGRERARDIHCSIVDLIPPPTD